MPTLRQKKASKLVETSRTMGEVLEKAGYSKATAIKPSQVTKSKGWQELMEKKLPDEELVEVHQKLLHATKIFGSPTEPDRIVDDNPTQLKAVELGYRVKRRLVPDIAQQFNVGGEMKLEFIKDA